MNTPVLVGYATRYGSTQEVAERIAAALRDCGAAVVCRPLRLVKSLDDYGAVLIGAPLYMFRWHADAMHFLGKHQQALLGRPTTDQ